MNLLGIGIAWTGSKTALKGRSFASKLMAGSTNNKKDSAGRRLGVKRLGGREVQRNEILIRQRGFKWHPGENTHYGRDQTIHASKEGRVAFTRDYYNRSTIHVVQQENPNRSIPQPPPFFYHPELYPELAAQNPEPNILPLPKRRQKKIKNPSSAGFRVLEPNERKGYV